MLAMTKDHLLVDAVSLSKICCKKPIQAHLKYATKENFIGKPIDGYTPRITNLCLLAPKAAEALCMAQTHFNRDGYSILVHDAYRPLRAVRYFTKWFDEPVQDEVELIRKSIHYPQLEKTHLPEIGYVASEVSRHCFGFAVDLTLVRLLNNEELDFGAIFDFFDPLSRTSATIEEIGKEAYDNRRYLAKIMALYGFKPFIEEFWHFDFHIQENHEPLDIEITAEFL